MASTRRAFLGAVAGGAISAGVGGVRPAAGQSLTPIKIGHVVLGDFGINVPTMVALEKGFFKQHGLAAEMIPFKGGPDLLKGVMAGRPTSASPAAPTLWSSASGGARSAHSPPSWTRTTSPSR
jgi:ABC-type nitrate/sulfonate/bicarbonate transport system substrate-binding protein